MIVMAFSSGATHLPQATLELWFVTRMVFSSHSEFVLAGYVYGHRRLRDGDPAVTSAILELSDDDSWARTMNTVYWLKEPGVSGADDSDWKLRVFLFASQQLADPAALQAIDLHATWPYGRSQSAKFVKPKPN